MSHLPLKLAYFRYVKPDIEKLGVLKDKKHNYTKLMYIFGG